MGTTPTAIHTRGGHVKILIIAGLLIAVCLAAWWLRRDGGGVPDPISTEHARETVTLIKRAIAATEDFDTQEADQIWQTLLQSNPDDFAAAQNAALNRILRVDQLTAKTTNATLAEDARQAARNELPDAIRFARESVEEFHRRWERSTKESDNLDSLKGLTEWMNVRIDLREASLLLETLARSTRRDVLERIAKSIQNSPQVSSILSGTMAEVLDSFGTPEDVSDQMRTSTTDTFLKVSENNVDNLFLAMMAARWGIADQRPTSVDHVQRTLDLSQAIAPELTRSLGSLAKSPQELVEKIIDQIRAGNWVQAANQMDRWFNLLNPTELVKTDRRRVTPHPLDRITFSGLRRWDQAASSQLDLPEQNSPLEFSTQRIPDTETTLQFACADLDLDLQPELIGVDSENKLTVYQRGLNDEWLNVAQLDLGIPVTGILVTDLFLVDNSAPDKIRIFPERTEVSDESNTDFATSARHNVVPTLLVHGPEGVRLVNADLRKNTAKTKRLQLSDRETGLEDIQDILSIVDGDLEGDGDLDLIVGTQSSGVRIFINRGSRQFYEADSFPDQIATDLTVADVDRDLDLDVLMIHQSDGTVGMLENLLHLQFRHRDLDQIPALPNAHGLEIAEIDGNVSWDVILVGPNLIQTAYTHTSDAGAWTVDAVETYGQGFEVVTFSDFNNDSSLEGLGPQLSDSGPGPLTAISFASDRENTDLDVTTSPADPNRIRQIVSTELSQDGLRDWVALDDDGLLIGVNETKTSNHHLQIRIKGIADNVSGRVNHYAIGSVLECRFGNHYRAQLIRDAVTHFGLDGIETADSVRIIFPNGLTQTIRRPTADSVIEEEQALKGSCPYLYSWDGEQFVFVTDCLWAAPLGLQVAQGVVAKDRPWEYLKVDGRLVAERDGYYELRLTEELWEIAYFDHVALEAVDHPVGTTIETNEKVGPPSIATPMIHAFDTTNRRTIRRAQDSVGEDVTKQLKSIDQVFVQAFDGRFRQGLCPPHWVDLEFERSDVVANPNEKILLVLTGWILPTDTSLNVQIDQNPQLPSVEYPSLWIPDPQSETGWKEAIHSIGFPGGKTKTMVVDVTQTILRNDPRLRVRTSAEIYWDAAELVVGTGDVETIVQPCPLFQAEVGYRGFSKRQHLDRTAPETYIFDQVRTVPRWPPLRGELTNFGSHGQALSRQDNHMVVIGAGDEIRLRFKTPPKEVPDGFQRDFVLHCVGWDKDADINTLAGQSVDPMPHSDMRSYPPRADDLVRAWNDRDASPQRHRRQSFRHFWRRPWEKESNVENHRNSAEFAPDNPSGRQVPSEDPPFHSLMDMGTTF